MARIVDTTANVLSSPVWAADFLGREHLVPGGAKLNAALFFAVDSVVVTVSAAGAAAAATSVPVAALTGAIPSGTVLNFGTNKFATLSAAAAAGATSLTVLAIPTALVSTDTARYAGVGVRNVPSGTLLGRTIAEREATTGYGPWASGDDEVYLLAFDVTDPSINADCELYRNYSIVKENFLPGWTNYTAGMKTALRLAYKCTTGAA
jgi:hypothetical protein